MPIKHRLPSEPLSEKSSARQSTTSAIFSVHGNHIISGTSKGFINIIEVASLTIIHSSKLSTGLFSLLRLTSNGRQLLANSTDRIIRVIDMPDLSKVRPTSEDTNGDVNGDAHEGYLDPSTIYLSATNQFTDVVNRLRWNHTSISPVASGSDIAEYVVASTCKSPASSSESPSDSHRHETKHLPLRTPLQLAIQDPRNSRRERNNRMAPVPTTHRLHVHRNRHHPDLGHRASTEMVCPRTRLHRSDRECRICRTRG